MNEQTFIPAKLSPSFISRDPEVQRAYDVHLRTKALGQTACDLCALGKKHEKRIELPTDLEDRIANVAEQPMGIFENEFPYRMYDFTKVTTHHLLIPLDHIASFDNLNEAAQQEYMLCLGAIAKTLAYDSVATRLPSSSASSIRDHMHTHLIKSNPKAKLMRLNYDAQGNTNPEVIFSDEIE